METKNSTEKINLIIEKTSVAIRKTKAYYDYIKELIKNTPLQIKILNIVVPLTLTYVFTIFSYNLFFSIFFALLTFFVISLMNIPIAIGFLVLYIIIVSNRSNLIQNTLGTPIQETDIRKKGPYYCANNPLIINNNQLAQTLNGGFFSYSFWIYIDNPNNISGSSSPTANSITWNNFRYNEWKSVFYRGTEIPLTGDLSSVVQYPGVWFTPVLNNMVIVFQNGNIIERLEVTNVPFNKWVNYFIVLEQKAVSIYIDGLLNRTLNLYQNISSDTNQSSIYVGNDALINSDKLSGFAGYIAQLIYYDYALTPSDIYQSYLFYKIIIDNYQENINNKKSYNYNISNLITNSDVSKI